MALYNIVFGKGPTLKPTPYDIIFGKKAKPQATPYDIIFGGSLNQPAPKPAAVAAPAPVQQQVAKAIPKVETPGKGANRGAVGSLGTSSGAGVAGNAQAGLLGSVNTEVQNDDMLIPYQKV